MHTVKINKCMKARCKSQKVNVVFLQVIWTCTCCSLAVFVFFPSLNILPLPSIIHHCEFHFSDNIHMVLRLVVGHEHSVHFIYIYIYVYIENTTSIWWFVLRAINLTNWNFSIGMQRCFSCLYLAFLAQFENRW